MAIPTPLVHHNAGRGVNGGLDDISGNGRDLTIYNGGEVIADTDSGGTRAFNTLPTVPVADSHFADSNTFVELDSSVECTVSAWIKYESGTGTQVIVANHAMNKGNIQLLRIGEDLYFYNSYFDSTISNTDNESLRAVDAIPNADQWYHIVITYDANEPATDLSTSQNRIICYVDGVKFSGTQQYFTNGTQPTGIVSSNVVGSRPDYSIGAIRERTTGGTLTGVIQYPFEGRIDDVRMWDTALTTAQITELSAGRNAANSYTGLGDEALWICPSLDQSTSDLSGNNRHGEKQGTAFAIVSNTDQGGSFAFNTTRSDFLTAPNPIPETINRSLCLWAYGDGLASFLTYDFIAGTYIAIQQFGGGIICRQELTTFSYQDVVINSSLGNNEWNHYAVTQDGSFLRTYLNGVLINSETLVNAKVSPESSEVILSKITGLTDDLRIYERAISDDEVEYIAASRGVEGGASGGGGSINGLLLGVG